MGKVLWAISTHWESDGLGTCPALAAGKCCVSFLPTPGCKCPRTQAPLSLPPGGRQTAVPPPGAGEEAGLGNWEPGDLCPAAPRARERCLKSRGTTQSVVLRRLETVHRACWPLEILFLQLKALIPDENERW